MANKATDRYNPKGVSDSDFESFRFSEIPENTLFWRFDDDRPNNFAFRKLNDKDSGNTLQTKSQEVVSLDANDIVFQKI